MPSHHARRSRSAGLRMSSRSCSGRIVGQQEVGIVVWDWRPETVVGWHRQGFRRYLAWKSRRRSGRPVIRTELRELIWRMSRANPLWGAPRIHGELVVSEYSAELGNCG
jgi:hypothetical protein